AAMPGGSARGRLLAELRVCLQDRPIARPIVLRKEGDLPVPFHPRRLGTAHRALPLEDDSFVNDEARRGYVSEDLAGGADLESLTCRDVAGHLAVNHDRRPRDLRGDHRALADRERVLGRDLALDLSLDSDRTFEGELAGDPTSLPEKRRPSPGLVHLHLLPLE